MFDHDHSAARGLMAMRKLVIFKHGSPLGNAPAHKLFEMVPNPELKDALKPPRAFSDYQDIVIPSENQLPANVTIQVIE
jgi:CRISPR-associated protein Csd2